MLDYLTVKKVLINSETKICSISNKARLCTKKISVSPSK
jgi:hypothetical protein